MLLLTSAHERVREGKNHSGERYESNSGVPSPTIRPLDGVANQCFRSLIPLEICVLSRSTSEATWGGVFNRFCSRMNSTSRELKRRDLIWHSDTADCDRVFRYRKSTFALMNHSIRVESFNQILMSFEFSFEHFATSQELRENAAAMI